MQPSSAGGLKRAKQQKCDFSHTRHINYLLNCWCVRTKPSSRMGNFTSQLPTMFWILKSRNLAGKPSFCTTRAYFLAANLDCSSLETRWVHERHIIGQEEENILLKGKARLSSPVETTLLWKSGFILWTLEHNVNKFWPLGSSTDHLPWAEDESSGPGFSYSHDDRSKTLQEIERVGIWLQSAVFLYKCTCVENKYILNILWQHFADGQFAEQIATRVFLYQPVVVDENCVVSIMAFYSGNSNTNHFILSTTTSLAQTHARRTAIHTHKQTDVQVDQDVGSFTVNLAIQGGCFLC